MKRVLILTGDGGEGYEAVVAAPSRRRLHMAMHDFEPGWDTYVERPGYGVNADAAVADVTADRFDAQSKGLFAICHGIQVFSAAGIVRGRKVTCYEHVRSEAEQAGAEWLPAQAVRDGRMVTAQTWESHPEFYREAMACLAS